MMKEVDYSSKESHLCSDSITYIITTQHLPSILLPFLTSPPLLWHFFPPVSSLSTPACVLLCEGRMRKHYLENKTLVIATELSGESRLAACCIPQLLGRIQQYYNLI